ncbi:MAG: hypothetical protein HY876_04835 [Coriobacteriales bacterium]|nr:hypothetical protein [Coriobacteriales bacterium]
MLHHRVTIALATALVALLAVPAVAYAAPAKSRAETGTYDLDFTLPTAGKSGCEVCHGDKNLVRIEDGQATSMYVNTELLKKSAHAKVACTQCHTDFAFKAPHQNAKTDEWKRIAKMSCRNRGCHTAQYEQMNLGAHTAAFYKNREAQAASSGDKKKQPPLCGDCHGGHDIAPLKDNPVAQRALHARGLKMCGECHEEQTGTYADYYHGAAYQRGAADAPACWQCHKAHEVYPTGDRRSPTNERNLLETCGGSAAGGAQCHTDINKEFVAYAPFIHGRKQVVEENPAWTLIDNVKVQIQDVFDQVRSWF